MNYRMKYLLEASNMRTLAKISAALLLSFIFFLNTVAQDIPARPSPPRLVNDFTGTLSKGQVDQLERKLVNFNNETSNQIVVVLVNSLNGYDRAQYAYAIGEGWGVGQKELDNGVVVLVKPKTAREKGQVYIASAYGLEGAIPDAIGKRIVENEMIPEFRQGNYYQGIDKATTILMELAKGEYSHQQYQEQTEGSPYAGIIPIFIILLVFLLIRVSRARSYTVGRGGGSFWTAMMLGSMLGSGHRHHGGGWGNFSSGSGNFGGGFGGFGGGSFGGGGAGGSW